MKTGLKLLLTLVLVVIAVALLIAGVAVGGYFYIMQPTEELKSQVRTVLLVASGVYLAVFGFFGFLIGAMWLRKSG
jgi:ABC-type phosphate transport system permease subunit